MDEAPETTQAAPTPAEQSGDQLGNILIASSVLLAFALCGGLLIGLWQSSIDDDDRDTERRRGEECAIDPSDAEERFAPECDDRDRDDDPDDDRGDGLFPDE